MGTFLSHPVRTSLRPLCSRIQGLPQEDHRARFYEHYRKEAEEYDREFMKKYDEDLNTTLIFVSSVGCSGVRVLTRVQAGLFSAVASAFIIEVNSELKPDPNDETVALLRVLIYKIDNTTFGDDAPTIPQWTGPPRTIVHVQAILFASLAASLFSAFLAMLGKQWLNRYASIDMRGPAIERSQNRQRKLDGIITWYFDYVMEALPLMLQVALLLLGCALSRYLWEINITVASVILTATSSGMIFYILIVVAGAASESCPYQTPGARIFRHILLPTLRSVVSKFPIFISSISQNARCCRLPTAWWSSLDQPWYSTGNINASLLLPLLMLIAPVVDAYFLGRLIFRLLVAFGRTVYRRFMGTSSPPIHGSGRRTAASDLRCISWMIQTSLDKVVHLSTLKHLATTTALADFDPTLIADCFNIFVGCINIDNCKVVIVQGLEELATASAMCCLRAISHLSAMDPMSGVLEDIRQQYTRVFPFKTDFTGLPFSHTLGIIHNVFYPTSRGRGERPTYFVLQRQVRQVQWEDYKPSSNEYIIVAHALTKLAWFEYRRRRCEKVPRWLLRFTLHSLSQDPLPPTPVVINCLTIIAIDMGCDPLNTVALDERCVHI
jgi:hypothetical protein